MRKTHPFSFCCPEVVHSRADDNFCNDENCCPEIIPTPKFPSPSSCLPEEMQLELEGQIEEINRLLLDLALSGQQPEEARRRAFDGLVGQMVEVNLNCPAFQAPAKKKRTPKTKRLKKKHHKVQLKNKLSGCVDLVGWDFVQITNEKASFIIPSLNIKQIKKNDHDMKPVNMQSLRNIDPCFRRALTFRFGETVSSSPELIQIFFRLRFTNFLLLLLDKEIALVLEEKPVKGMIGDVSKETITICKRENENIEFPLESICYMIVPCNLK